MPRTKSNSKIYLGGFVLIVTLVSAVTIYANSRFRASERAVAEFCDQGLVGEIIYNATKQASDRGLLVSRRAKSDSGESSLSIGSDGRLLSAISFCTLFHDGDRITRVAYNPWYH